MKSIKIVACCSILLICTVSCKKDKKEEVVTNPETVVPSGPGNCFGTIGFEEHLRIFQGSVDITKYSAKAYFWTNPLTDNNKTDAQVGNVMINGITLKKYGGFTTHQSFYDTTNSLYSLPQFTLNATGSASVDPFSFEYKNGTPNFSDTSLIPRVISRSTGVNLELNTISNADSVIVTITRESGPNFFITKRVGASGKSQVNISFTGTEISEIMSNFVASTIHVQITKQSYIRVGKVDYLVSHVKSYSRYPVYVSVF